MSVIDFDGDDGDDQVPVEERVFSMMANENHGGVIRRICLIALEEQ